MLISDKAHQKWALFFLRKIMHQNLITAYASFTVDLMAVFRNQLIKKTADPHACKNQLHSLFNLVIFDLPKYEATIHFYPSKKNCPL